MANEKKVSSHLTYQELWDAVRFRDMPQIDAWVSEGRDLFDYDRQMTIYHIASQCGSVDFIEELVRRHPTTTHLIMRGSKDGSVTSLHWCCCMTANEKDDSGHSVGILDALCRAAGPGQALYSTGNEDAATWMDWANDDEKLSEYITWRKHNTAGLPPEIRRLDNRSIHQYIQTFGSMGSESAERYKQAIKGKTETSYCIRLVFLGHEGVGKTTLMLRMTDQDVSKLKPTNQLDVLLNLLIIDRINKQRKLLQPGMEQEVTRQRLRDVIVDSFLSDSSSETEDGTASDAMTKPPDTPITDGIMNRSLSTSSESSRASLVTPTTPSDVMTSLPTTPLTPDTVFTAPPMVTSAIHTEAAVVMTSGPTEDFGQRGHKNYVSVFDFGGEMMFSNFQHIFLNKNAVILLCFSLHNCFQNDAILDRVYFWLKFLSTFSDASSRYQPPVILVGTHLDMVEESRRTSIRREVRRTIKSDPQVATAYDRHVVEFVVIDSTVNVRSAYDGLWNLVLEAAVHQSQWGQLLPATWITLERDLMLLKGQGIKVMTLDEVNARARNLVVPLDERDVLAMLEYLHVIRSILSFQLDNPNSRIILDPQWLIQAFRLIVTTVKFRQRGLDPDLILEYDRTRRLTIPFINAVWTKGDTDGFMEFRDTILFYLDRLELIVKPLPKEDETCVDYYIVPCLLDEPNPNHIRPLLEQKGTIKSPTLCFEFRERFIPPAVYNKILASCIHRFEVLRLSDQDDNLYLQQGLACFAISVRWNMALHCKDSQIKATLFSNTVKKVEEGDGYMVRVILETIIQTTMKRSHQGHLKFDYYVSDDFQVKNDESMIKVLITTQVKSRSRRSIGTAVWFTERKQLAKPSLSAPQSERTLLRRCPKPREVIRIAKYVGNTYTLFFGIMGMNEVRVQQLREQFEHGQRLDFLSVIARITFAWKDEFGNKANFMQVKNAFEFCGLDLTGLFEDIKQLENDKVSPEDLGIPACIQNSCPLEEEISDISMIILKAYFIVFVELNITIETIELAEMDHSKALDLIIYLVEHWMKKYKDKATIRQLYLALRECKRNYTKLIELVKRRQLV